MSNLMSQLRTSKSQLSSRMGVKRKLSMAAAAVVAMAVPSATRALDFVFTPTVGTTGNVLNPTQYDNTVTLGASPAAGNNRLDIAGGFTGNFGPGTFGQSLSLTTFYIGAESDGPAAGEGGGGTNATSGDGTFNMSSGTLTVSKWTELGQLGGQIGVFNQTGGTFNQLSDNFAVGLNGQGQYNISNGAVANITGEINVGRWTSGSGTMTVSGANTVVKSTARLGVGIQGQGQLDITGGSVTSLGDFQIATDQAAVGVVNQSGGSVVVATTDGQNARWLRMAQSAASTATYNISGGKLDVYGGRIDVAENGNGTFNISGTAAVTLHNSNNGDPVVFVSNNSGSVGTLNISSGSLTTAGNGAIRIGENGGSNGTINQSGGVVNVGGWIDIGNNGQGVYNMSGGTLTAQQYEISVGRNDVSGLSALNVSNTATITAGNRIEIGGDLAGGTGTGSFNITNANLTLNTPTLRIASNSNTNGAATGTMTVTGTSVVNLSGSLVVGADAAGTGKANLNDTSVFNAKGNLGGFGTITNAGVGNSTLNLGEVNGTGNQTFSGQIVDGTGLINVNILGGNQVFATNQVYSGSTTINAGGTLQLGTNGTTGGVKNATIINNGTLAISRSDTPSFTNQISGSGGVLINGSGAVQFANPSYAYTGPTFVNPGTAGGALALVNGTTTNNIASSSGIRVGQYGTLNTTGLSGGGITLASGQDLSGTGTVTGNVTVATGSSISAGNNPTIGTLNVVGNVSFANGSTFNSVFGTAGASSASNGVSSLLNIVGNVTFGTGITFNALSNGGANGQGILGTGYYDILNYSGTQTGFGASTFISPVNAAYGFSNIAHLGGGGEIDVFVGALTAFDFTGNVSNVFDINTTKNFTSTVTGASVFLNQFAVRFNDTNPTNGATITNNNVSIVPSGVIPLAVTFTNSAIDYTFTNAGGGTVGIGGTTGILKTGTGSVFLNGANTFSGAVAVNAGVLGISNNASLGKSAGVTIANGASLQISNNITTPAGTPINVSGTGTASNPGVLNNLSGNNTLGGAVTLNGDSTFNLASGTLSLGNLSVSTNVTSNTLRVQGAGSLAVPSLQVGSLAGTQGVVVVNASTINVTGGADSRIGGAGTNDASAVGILDINAGSSVNSVNNFQVGAYGTGAMTINGGAFSQSGTGAAGFPVLGRFTGSYGVATVQNGGSLNETQPGTFLIVGEQGTGVLNVGNGGTVNTTGNGAGLRINQNGGDGIVNLATGGLINTQAITGGGSTNGGTSTFNFHGGTLQASANSGGFINAIDNAYVYNQGAVIDSGSNTVNLASSLTTPTGNGVTSIALTGNGSGYTGTPVIKITGGGGTGATAVPVLGANGTITSILITNPGVGYTGAPTVSIVGGGGVPATFGAVSLTPNTGGSLTKIGTGTLTLSGSNTYTGATLIQAGTLRIGAGSFAAYTNQAGLSEGLVAIGTNSFDNNPNHKVPHSETQLSLIRANSTQAGTALFPDNSTVGYSGLFNVTPAAETATGGIFTFAENFDDSVYLAIDGQQILNDTAWNTTTMGTAALSIGLHKFELRLGQGGGGVGPPGGTNGGVLNTGLGVAYSLDGGASFIPIEDTGNGQLLQTGSGPASGALPMNTPVIMSSNTTLDVNGFGLVIGSIADAAGATNHAVTLGNNGSLTVGNLNTSTLFSGVISDTNNGKLVKVGTGTLTLSGNNTFAGGTTINGGILQVGNNGPTGTLGSGPIVINSQLVINRTGTLALSNPISGSGALNHIGSAVTTITADNGVYTGPIGISAGTIVAASANALGSGNVNLGGGTLSFASYGGVTPTLSGFGPLGDGTGWTSQDGGVIATPAFGSNVLTLTDGANGQARSAFLNAPQSITSFVAKFTYKAVAGNGNADGAAFVIQNDVLGATALGGGGGSLGYNTIGNSAALEINIYGPNTPGTAFNLNGATGNYTPTGGVTVNNGDPIQVTLTYNGGTSITETLLDTVTSASFSKTFNTPVLTGVVGGSNTALIGFTGATGGENATQTISNFVFGVPSIVSTTTYANNVVLAPSTNSNLDVPTGLNISLSGTVTGTGGVTKTSNGTLNLTNPAALTLGGLSASGGNLNIGPATGLVAPLTINTMAISGSATVTLNPTATAATASGVKTNFVKTLTIGANGLLDLQNHFVSVDNTATPFATVKQYIDAAYNRNVVSGIGDYNGRGGITSSVVKANADFMGVGYYDGALQDPANPDNVGQIYGPHRNDPTPVGIPLTQILIRPTLTGDLNGDGLVNTSDVVQFNSYGLFGSPTNLGYQAGDLNGDGKVNATDVTIFNSAGNFNSGSYLVAKAAKAATTLTGHSASPATTTLNPASGTLAFSYDPATGDVHVMYNGFTGFAGKPTFNSGTRLLSLIDIASTGGIFALDSTKLAKAATDALSSPTITGNTEINLTAVNGYLPDGTDIGKILAPGLDPAQLANALTLSFNYSGSRNTSGGVAGLIVPEPATLSLIGFGALGLLARRRRSTKAKVLN